MKWLLVSLAGALMTPAATQVLGGEESSALAGTWTWSWKDPKGDKHTHILEVEGMGTKLAARERFDDLPPVVVSKLTFDGKSVRFTVVRGNRRAAYSGVLDKADTINGTVTITTDGQSEEHEWQAKRKPAAKADDGSSARLVLPLGGGGFVA